MTPPGASCSLGPRRRVDADGEPGQIHIFLGVGTGRGQGAWTLFEPVRGSPTFVEIRPAHRLVYVGRARPLLDQYNTVWQVVERLMAETK